MIRILTVEDMRASDAAQIASGTSQRELIGRAALAIYDAIGEERLRGGAAVVCGKGNNGEDGRELARVMRGKGFRAQVYEAADVRGDVSAVDTEKNPAGTETVDPLSTSSEDAPPEMGNGWTAAELCRYPVVIDCIFGTGFHSRPEGAYARAIKAINEAGSRGCFIVSADINSGLSGGNGLAELCVKSDLTISIGNYQPGHFLAMAADVMKAKVCKDIGIAPRGEEIYLLEEEDVAQCFLPRKNHSHKGDYGYVALAGGSFRYSGAIRLAGMAEKSVREGTDEIGLPSAEKPADADISVMYRSESYAPRHAAMAQSAVTAGAGVVMLALPRSLCYAVRPDILESTLYPLSDADGELVFVPEEWDELIRSCKVIAIGMGIGNTKETAAAVRYLLENYTGRLLIDADGLNALAGLRISDAGDAGQCRQSGDAGQCRQLQASDGKEAAAADEPHHQKDTCTDGAEERSGCILMLREARCDVVLTPHPAEMARLCGCTVSEVLDDPVKTARTFAARSGAVVLLKGTATVVSDGARTYMSDKGCAGMATGGSGDVLSGVLAAMLGYWDPDRMPLCRLTACAAWTAGLAGELAQQESCDIAMKASDTALHVRDAVTYLRKH